MGADQYWHLHAALRTLQFLLAIVVAALYGVDLYNATKTHTKAPSAWIYAEVVVYLSVLTCAIHCFVIVKRVGWCMWEWVLFILWVSLFGVFGEIYIGGEKEMYVDGRAELQRMKIAVWIDLVNVVLWFASSVQGIVWCCATRRITRNTDSEEFGGGIVARDVGQARMQSDKESIEDDLKWADEKEIQRDAKQQTLLSRESTLKDSDSTLKEVKMEDMEH
jgi:hypothetical protein